MSRPKMITVKRMDRFLEEKMKAAFVSNGNEPLFKDLKAVEAVPEVRDIEWFKQQLQSLGVGLLEIVWGNHVEQFHEIPPEVMDRYLKYRKNALHRKALELALQEGSV